MIAPDGRIFQGRPLNRVGAFHPDYNRTHIIIALLGDSYNNYDPSQAMRDSLDWLVDFLWLRIPTITDIMKRGNGTHSLGFWFDIFSHKHTERWDQ